MKVQSTGLGKSVMVAHLNQLSITDFQKEKVMQMTMESSEPLHWYIQVYMEPKDVRQAVLMGLKPSVIWKGLLALLFGRFNLFSKGPMEKGIEEPDLLETEKPKSPPAPAPPPLKDGEKEATVSPLAKLKG
jgi:hypothetical protein